MKFTNEKNLPDSIVQAVTNDDYSRGDADISITQLIDPPRKITLEQQFDDQLTEDVSTRIWALIGQAIHTVLERSETVALPETRLSTMIGGWKVSGKMDRIRVIAESGDDKTICMDDYKVTTVWSVKDGKPKREWIEQQNCYAHLLRANGYTVDQMHVIVIFRDWSKLQARRDRNYPQDQVMTIGIPVWSPERALNYMETRVALHKQAREILPECTDEDRWAKPTVYAVMKAGRKSALRLLSSYDEAMTWAERNGHVASPGFLKDGFSIVKRPGELVRCANYCAAAPFCEQWKKSPQFNAGA